MLACLQNHAISAASYCVPRDALHRFTKASITRESVIVLDCVLVDEREDFRTKRYITLEEYSAIVRCRWQQLMDAGKFGLRPCLSPWWPDALCRPMQVNDKILLFNLSAHFPVRKIINQHEILNYRTDPRNLLGILVV